MYNNHTQACRYENETELYKFLLAQYDIEYQGECTRFEDRKRMTVWKRVSCLVFSSKRSSLAIAHVTANASCHVPFQCEQLEKRHQLETKHLDASHKLAKTNHQARFGVQIDMQKKVNAKRSADLAKTHKKERGAYPNKEKTAVRWRCIWCQVNQTLLTVMFLMRIIAICTWYGCTCPFTDKGGIQNN